jgi:ABC-2 type transport system permease protein
MSLRRSLAVTKHELRLLLRSPGVLISLVAMPLMMMAFFKPLFKTTLHTEGFGSANGAEQAVPGLSVLFALFLVTFVAFGFFREHGWGTWQRLLSSAASPAEIMLGKVLPPALLAIVQQVVLFASSVLLLGLHISGSLIALLALVLALTICLVAFGLLCAAFVRDAERLNTIGNLGAILIGGLGGGLAPVAVLPAWAQAVAPGTPSYWAIRGYRDVVLRNGGVGDVLLPVAVLLGFAVVVLPLALRRFRFDEVKTVSFS